MTQETPSSIAPLFWTFIAGAALGAVVTALATPKSGPELQNTLKALGRRAKRRAGDLADDAGATLDDLKGRTVIAAAHLKGGLTRAIHDLRHEHLAPAHAASQDGERCSKP
jgi:gas vesicle protein